MALTALKVAAQLKGTISKTMTDGAVPSFVYNAGLFEEVPTDADLLFTNGYSISTASSQSLDLAGSLVDALGVACVFSKVYAILIVNTATLTGRNIQVGGDAASVPIFGAGADYVTIGPKGCFFACNMLDGWAVTATSGDIIKIANSAGGATIVVDVAILGKA